MAPNHTGLFPGVLHHDLRGMLEGSAEMHVSPVSILQYTLMASSELPWFGSTQYSPVHHTIRLFFFFYQLLVLFII